MLTPFARWLKVRRVRSTLRGEAITQRMLADAVGVSYYAIAAMENGDQHPDYEMTTKLAEFFGDTSDTLFLKSYQIPPDMYLFLTTTVEGEKIVKNLRKIMDGIEQKGGWHQRPDIPDVITSPEIEGGQIGRARAAERIRFFSQMDVERAERTLEHYPERTTRTAPRRVRRYAGAGGSSDPDGSEDPGEG